jgi:hypothetical protein
MLLSICLLALPGCQLAYSCTLPLPRSLLLCRSSLLALLMLRR